MVLAAFPIFLKLAGRPCLMVGGGAVAARKVELLLRGGADLTVAAPSLVPELAALAEAGRLRHVEAFEPGLIEGRSLVFVATEDARLAREVAEAAELAGVPVNVVDRPELSSFLSGAVVDRAPVLVAISTGGTAPVLARELRLAIERLLPPRLGQLARFAERFRHAVRASLPSAAARRRFWQNFFQGPVAERLLAGNEAGASSAMVALVNRPEDGHAQAGMVHILVLRTREADLLTLRAQRLLGAADLVIHDGAVAPSILDAARRDARRVELGAAAPGALALLSESVRGGQRVVRLLSNDGAWAAEEYRTLRARGVSASLVPGIAIEAEDASPHADAVNA